MPDFAEVYYYARHNDMRVLDGIWERIINAARGAALGTGTTMELEMTGAVWNVLPNSYLVGVMQKNLLERRRLRVHARPSGSSPRRSARRSTATLPPIDSAKQVFTPKAGIGSASTDLGDVSWRVPTVQMTAATWVPGTPAHSWQAVAAGGMSIGAKGMIVAAKTMALTAIDLFTDPAHIAEGARRVRQAAGTGLQVHDAAGRPEPALDYRK